MKDFEFCYDVGAYVTTSYQLRVDDELIEFMKKDSITMSDKASDLMALITKEYIYGVCQFMACYPSLDMTALQNDPILREHLEETLWIIEWLRDYLLNLGWHDEEWGSEIDGKYEVIED